MKTKNQTEHAVLELPIEKAANDDGIISAAGREATQNRKPGWNPKEVWRTRVKAPTIAARGEPSPL